ncbi:MAG: Crp/Fnr family transcriptional regulator [Tenacibaculum sp.]|nr:Crp/Fnr family transcriptional regulator [Tenacibaculum sp.]
MKEHAVKYIKGLTPSISNKNIQLILEDVEYKKFKKGEVLSKKGEIPKHFYIIKSGVARSFHIDKNGKEVINSLFISPDICGSIVSLLQQIPANATCDCITNCEVLIFDYTKFKSKLYNNFELNKINIAVLERVSIRFAERINNLTLLNATDRYLKLKKEIPNIEDLVKQYHIASFLNITPVQLSRIRKKLNSK